MKITTEKAVKKLTSEWKKDINFRYSWQANIAMAFKDEYARRKAQKKYLNKQDIHEIANTAADYFLNLLCR